MTDSKKQTRLAALATACATFVVYAACTNAPVGAAHIETAAQALSIDGGPDLVLTGTSDGGANSYIATLPVSLVVGTISQTLEADWDSTVHSPTQPPIFPQYWTLDYYAGATKLDAGPATPADWASISRVVATGAINVQGIDGARQALFSSITAPPPVFPSSFAGGSSGDGWDVFFDPAHTKVFNLHHHDSPPNVMCHNLADSSICPGYPIALTQTSTRATGFIDAISNKLWQPTVTFAGVLAWDCVDLTTSARCATPVVSSVFHAANTSYENHMDPVVIGRKMYAVGFTNVATARITCLDMSTATECSGVQLVENGSSYASGIDAIGNSLYVLATQNGKLDCYDSTSMTRCSGAWPQQTSSTGRVHATPSADGVLRNICADWQCWAADGSATTLPPGYLAYASANRENGLGCCGPQYANMGTSGTRVAWAGGSGGPLQCWDIATDAKCSTAFPFSVPSLYTAKFDPEDNDCIWTNADDGIIRNYQVPTGAPGCSGGPPKISFKASLSIPRLGCDPATRVFEYKSFKLIAPDPTQYTSATVTVINSTGAALVGWTNVPLPGNSTLDLTALSTATAGETPTFSVAATGLTDAGAGSVPAAEFRVTTDSTPQLCWDLAVPPLVCPTTAGIASTTVPGPQVTTVVAKGSFGLDGGGITNFTDQTLTPTVTANPANLTNCGGTLSATVRLANNTPVAGVQVFLLNSAGVAILDGSGQPVFATSATDGSLSFGVWAATYKLQLPTIPQVATPVSMTITAGGSGTTTATGGVVTSGVITVSLAGTASVAVVMTLPPGAPTITSPTGGWLVVSATPTVQGTCISGDSVRVSEGAVPVCQTFCSSSTFSCVTSSLADGAHNLVAAQTDDVNTSPNSVRATFIVDTTPAIIIAPTEGLRTNNAAPLVSGTCETGATVRVFEGGASLCSASCTRGAFSCVSSVLAEGGHTLLASETDPALDVGPNSLPRNITIDTTLPAAPAIVAPTEGLVTNNTTPTVSGTCEPAAAVGVFQGVTALCSTTCTGGGTFSCVSRVLAEGPQSMTAGQTDLAGNVGPSSPLRNITIDVTLPTAPVVLAPTPGLVTNNATPTFTGTCETGATVSVFEGSTSLCSVTCASGAFSCVSTVLAEGAQSIVVRQTDPAGNVGPNSPSLNITVDTTPPSAPVILAPIEGLVTNNTTPAFSGTCEASATVAITENGGLICSATCTGGGTFLCAPAVLTEGAHQMVAGQTDLAGNVGPNSPFRDIIIDITPPAVPVIVVPTQGLVTNNNTPTVAGTCETGAMVTVFGGETALCSSLCSNSAFSCVSSVLPEGAQNLVANQMDPAGNAGRNSPPTNITVDTTAPVPPVIAVPTEGLVTNNITPTVSGTCETGATVGVSEGATLLCSTTCASSTFSCVSSVLAEGAHSMVAGQTDPAGNVGPNSPLRNITIDVTSPADPVIAVPIEGLVTNNTMPTIAGTCETGTTVTISEGETTLCSATCTGGTFSCVSIALAEGAQRMVASQIDKAGNASRNSPARDITVDTTPPLAPVIVIPTEGLATNNNTPIVAGTCETGAAVRVSEGATSLCSATCTSGAFSCVSAVLGEGPHWLVAAQTDLAGNGGPYSLLRNITVDTTPPDAPIIVAPTEGLVTSNNTPTVSGACESGTAVIVSEGATALCSTTCVSSTFTCVSTVLSDAHHTLVARQTDAGGTALSTARSFVVDAAAPPMPVVTSPTPSQQVYDVPTPFLGTAEPGNTVAVTVNGNLVCTLIASAQGTWICSSSLPGGEYVVTATATDPAGINSSPSTGVPFTQRVAIDSPQIVSPAANAQIDGPSITATGTSKPGSTVTITDDTGAMICTTLTDDAGVFQCTGNSSAGQRTLVATSSWMTFNSVSPSVLVTVLTRGQFGGGGCGATGAGEPAVMLVFFASAVLLLRRRRA